VLRASCFVVLAACSPKSDDQSTPPPLPNVPADATIDGITTICVFDPSSGMHLDDDNPNGRTPPKKKSTQPAVPIGIMLKSEPSGATVLVDGENIGPTPKYWSGMADGNEHEFAFTKQNYALARYRFVPITSGVLHATLERVNSGETLDAGLEPLISPKLVPDAAVFTPDAAVAPPPTVLTPIDAASIDATSIDAAPKPDAPRVVTPDAAE
jgi:hypothetical protein